ncbi:uncharacterized protein BDR25DRAFT_285993 [Lindgomyces ingoldianus]|uniref:Uncharacterized protein n=1 Tax=Lindgomyces ingoldianus TaxID=673940 RepID=A0ACB6QWM7_9PLEO|nr:uncharacterized protein BDR25DRAFT_285993 [Lindgomyces ingoldianus]KAF2471404.1 hypothetical protein BDR25DRAFT_285993 [Lindgomyces ingoldianus]
MPPIPIHKNDPIQPVAAKPDGVTPQTANPPPTRTTPASIPATTTADANANPPPPQPGARPIPPTASTAAPTSSSFSPPAPQPGYTATLSTTETRLGGLPPQFTIPPPSDSQLAGRSTTAARQASKPGPTTLNMAPAASPGEDERSLEHPPGYVQNSDNRLYAAEGSATDGQQESDGGVGSAAWNVLNKAGAALKKGEEAAWRAVRNKG